MYSDNKYLNKVHNITKGLSGTLNFNEYTKNETRKRLPYSDFKNVMLTIN